MRDMLVSASHSLVTGMDFPLWRLNPTEVRRDGSDREIDGCGEASVFSQAPAQLLGQLTFVNCKIISIMAGKKISKGISAVWAALALISHLRYWGGTRFMCLYFWMLFVLRKKPKFVSSLSLDTRNVSTFYYRGDVLNHVLIILS